VERLELQDHEGVGRGPRLGLVSEEHELDREGVAALLDELVHTHGVRGQRGARLVGQQRRVELGRACEPDRANELVRLEAGVTEDLGELAAPGATEEIELEQAVLRRRVSLKEEQVVRRVRVDVRDAVAVADDLAALVEAEEAVVAVERRLRPGHEERQPAGDRQEHHEQERERDGALAEPRASHCARMTINSAPPSTFVPSATAICAIVPAWAARSSFSIFIASSVTRASPSLTEAPRATCTRLSSPGIGARISCRALDDRPPARPAATARSSAISSRISSPSTHTRSAPTNATSWACPSMTTDHTFPGTASARSAARTRSPTRKRPSGVTSTVSSRSPARAAYLTGACPRGPTGTTAMPRTPSVEVASAGARCRPARRRSQRPR